MIPLKGKGRKWVAFGVVVRDGRDWMISAKSVRMPHRGIKKRVVALDMPGDGLASTNPTCGARARQVDLYVCGFVLCCLYSVVSSCFLPAT